jgi:hypothetical protein
VTPLFNGYQILQEYPVNKVNPEYPSGREHFDWVVLTLKIVIEVMGEQHVRPVCFGGVTIEAATEAFHAQVARDKAKAEAAIAAGWTYITIPHNVDLTLDYIMEQYYTHLNPLPASKIEKKLLVDWAAKYAKAKERYQNSSRYQSDKERAKLSRQVRYRKMKELKKRGY